MQNNFNTNDETILVFSIGKVGSSSIYNSIKKAKSINIPIYHIHSLSQEQIVVQKKYYKNSNRKSLPMHLIQSSVISDALKNYKGKVYIFTLIREPISREISSVFQDSFNFTKQRNIRGDVIEKVIDDKIKM